MTVRVFLSSTKDDLDKNCRPRVLEAILKAQAEPVAMELWASTYRPALDLVLRKIEESTHYLGLFAYRRGWIPPGRTDSITEAEFDHALEKLPDRINVFIPKDGSPIAQALLELARQGQDEAATEEQARFLARVRTGGVVEFFEDVEELMIITMRCVMSWKYGSVLDRHPEPAPPPLAAAPAPPPARAVPAEQDVAELGRQAQAECFERDVIERLTPAGDETVAGVLVSGPPGHGHRPLMERLRRRFERESGNLHPLVVGCRPAWRDGGLEGLLAVLAREAGVGAFADVGAAAAHLGTLLGKTDVVLQVTLLQHFEDGVPGFVERFWSPLVAALPAGTPFRLLCLASHEGPVPAPPAWDAAVQACGGDAWDGRRLLRLPPLAPFTERELRRFLRPRVSDRAAEDTMVSSMMDGIDGNPGLLYQRLMEPDYWTL
jgi:hypothetical protein